MFNCDNPNIIISDEGSSVQVLGPSGLRYKQGERWLRVSSVPPSTDGMPGLTRGGKLWPGYIQNDAQRSQFLQTFLQRQIEILSGGG